MMWQRKQMLTSLLVQAMAGWLQRLLLSRTRGGLL
jgi:hypothetical protein